MALLERKYPTVTAYLGFESQGDEYNKWVYPLRETPYFRVLTIGISHNFILKKSSRPVAHRDVQRLTWIAGLVFLATRTQEYWGRRGDHKQRVGYLTITLIYSIYLISLLFQQKLKNTQAVLTEYPAR